MADDNMDNTLQPASNPENLDPQKAIDLENGVNQGVIAPTPEELEKVSAAEPVFGLNPINPSQNWDKFFSTPYDPQSSQGFDTLGCNIFSSVHSCEASDNILHGANTNYSERFSCVVAGLNGSQGSSEGQWEDGIKNFGLLLGTLLPFTPGMSRAEFFKTVPDNLKAEARKFFDKYDVSFRQIATDRASIKEALKFAPVKIFIGTGAGWNRGRGQVIPKTNNPMGHAVLVSSVEDIGTNIYDQYAPFLKTLATDYTIYFAFQTILTEKNKPLDRGIMMLPDGHTEAVYVKIGTPIKPISEIQNMPDTGLVLSKDGRTVIFYSKEGTQFKIDELKDALEIPANASIDPSNQL
jgi:hypothetical protein